MKAYITSSANGGEKVIVEMTKEQAIEYVQIMGHISANDLNRMFEGMKKAGYRLPHIPHISHAHAALAMWFPLHTLVGEQQP